MEENQTELICEEEWTEIERVVDGLLKGLKNAYVK